MTDVGFTYVVTRLQKSVLHVKITAKRIFANALRNRHSLFQSVYFEIKKSRATN